MKTKPNPGAGWKPLRGFLILWLTQSFSSLGSAMLAGVAAGVFASHQEAAAKCIRLKDEILPTKEGIAFYEEHFALYKQIQAALAPIYHKL